MRSLVTAVIAAIEAVAVALAGLAVVAVPALVIWVVTFGLAAEPSAVASDVAGVWLLAHLVPLHFSLSAEAALGLGLAPEALTFTLSLAPLGLTLLTVLLALRAGWRFAGRGGVGAMGVLGGAAGFGAIASAAAALAQPLLDIPSALAALTAAAVYGASSAAAFLVRAARDGHSWWEASVKRALQGIEGLGVASAGALPARAAETIRLAAAGLALVLGIAALGFTIAVATGYADVTALTQGLQLDPIGSLALFLVQLAFVPIAIIWSLSWMVGTGFAVGTGSSVTPFDTLLGPMPALPMFGLIPDGWGDRGALAPAIIVVAALGLGVLFARRPVLRLAPWGAALAVPVLAAALTGLAVAAVCALAGGSIGPDRLAESGPDAWLTGALVALEVAGGLVIGVVAGRSDAAKVRAAIPDRLPGLDAIRRARESDSAVPVPAPAAAAAAERGRGIPGAAGATGASAAVAMAPAGDDGDAAYEAAFEDALQMADERDAAELDLTADADPELEPDSDQDTAVVPDLDAGSDADPADTRDTATDAADTGAGAAAETAADSGETAELSDEASLLRAYSWDAAPADAEAASDAAGEAEPRRRWTGWRWPGRGD